MSFRDGVKRAIQKNRSESNRSGEGIDGVERPDAGESTDESERAGVKRRDETTGNGSGASSRHLSVVRRFDELVEGGGGGGA